ncbi:MAG: zinc ABC transporter substrate-binding protein [Mogibacterium sp.]|nr:zinc ABC transporter substrate-binding protein [Mogibacterium sp.]
MRKILSLLIATILVVSGLSACGTEKEQGKEADDKIQIVTTIFPIYDWVNNILGDNPANIETTMLLDSGVDLHSFQPSADDIQKIANCDIFVYVGGESDGWTEDALKEISSKNAVVLNLMDLLGDSVKEEEIIEGMQEEAHEHGEDGEHEADEHGEHDEDSEHEAETDEHIWLSLRNASVLTKSISEAVEALDPENAEVYKSNSAGYIAELEALDKEYQAAVSETPKKTLLFGDRFPLRYLTDDYGLSYYAAFPGCSAECEASFETISFLAQKVDELELNAVMTIEKSDKRIAETIIENTNRKDRQILSMDSMQSVTAKDVQNGASYLSVMKDNLTVLKEALK